MNVINTNNRLIKVIAKSYRLQSVGRQQPVTGIVHNASLPTCSHKCDFSTRFYSTRPEKQPGFFGQLIKTLQEEMDKNKELKENMERLKKEAAKLEGSDAIQSARAKYRKLEVDRSVSSEQLKKKAQTLLEQAKKLVEESQVGKKGGEVSESVVKSAREALEALDALGSSSAVKSITDGARSLQQDLDDIILYRAVTYRKPAQLRKRSDCSSAEFEAKRKVDINTEATGLELHKDSRWYEGWKNLTENNRVLDKLYEWKMQYDESDSRLARTGRFFTDKAGSAFSSVLGSSSNSETLTAIAGVDPDFSLDGFLKLCEHDIIPNVFESVYLHDLDVLKDWCSDVAFKQLSQPIEQAKKLGHKYVSRTMDISRIDFQLAKLVEQGPVIVVSFWAQQLIWVSDSKGIIIEGDAVKPMRVTNTWLLCRDMEEYNPRSAWKVMEVHQFAETLLL